MTESATDKIRKDWDSQANAWFDDRESLFAASLPIHDWLVSHVDPRPGQRILEIAAGPGDTGFMAAKLLGDGRLTSTDLSTEMLDAARKRAAELGIQSVDFRALDAQGMDLPDASFDGVLCRWGFMLMPDPAAALRESKRVLKPGGRLAFAVFTGPEENPFASLPARTLVEMGRLPKPTGEWRPGILALGDRARLDALVAGIGFATTTIERVGMTWTFRDAAGYWDFLIDLTALGPLIRSLPDGQREQFRATINERLIPFTTRDALDLPSHCWCGVCTR